MEFFRKSFLIVLIVFISCSQFCLLENKLPFEAKAENIEIWFDAMPKISGLSSLHLNMNLILKNKINKIIEIDSTQFIISVEKNFSFIIDYPELNDFIISPNSIEFIPVKASVKGSKIIFNQNNIKSNLFVRLSYKVSGKNFSREVFLGEKEIEVVY